MSARQAAASGLTVAELIENGAKALIEDELKSPIVGKSIWVHNKITDEPFKIRYDQGGTAVVLHVGSGSMQPSLSGDLPQRSYQTRPSQPWVEIERSGGIRATVVDFVRQGFEHILSGPDHLLFVLGLLLLARSQWMLVKTITAFTVAHSVTLAATTLGYVKLPAAPIEALIALSIVFLGVEIVRTCKGTTSFAVRNPWALAFAFGLLHGFGFAGALSAAGQVGLIATPSRLRMTHRGAAICPLARMRQQREAAAVARQLKVASELILTVNVARGAVA